MRKKALVKVLSSVLLAGLCAATAATANYRLEAAAGGPPEELVPAVRETLAVQGLRIVGPGGPLCEIWFRKAVPARTGASQELGVAFPQLAEGTLVGAIRFFAVARDFRRQQIKPGVYALRYGVHPTDGNHQGVAPQRDFLLLVPAAGDAGGSALAPNELLALSRKASGTSHPSVWSLESVEGSVTAPSLVHKEEEEHWVIHFSLKLQAEGGAVSARAAGLVIVGSAPEA